MELRSEGQISKIEVSGYKSIDNAEINLNMLNVLIGSNGAGKSNFISIFKFLDELVSQRLQVSVSLHGGADNFLFFGSKTTSELKIDFSFGNNGYNFVLKPTPDDHFIFANECFYWNVSGNRSLGTGHLESKWKSGTNTGIDEYVQDIFKKHRWRVYHFHDTSDTAPVKKNHLLSDNLFLRSHAQNLGAFLYRLRETSSSEYSNIIAAIRSVAPFFDDFVLEPNPLSPDNIQLMWKDVRSEVIFTASQLSDGTLRFICLAVLLLQPVELMPDSIIIDEPELGLHPFAIQMLAEMMKKASSDKQVIVSTQSITLLNEFTADDIIVVDHIGNHTEFNRYSCDRLNEWLQDGYSLGDLWQKNVLGGRPSW